MQLVLRLEESLAVQRLAIRRNQRQVGYAITFAYRDGTDPAMVKTAFALQRQQAVQRLAWFESLISLMLNIETCLVLSQSFFENYGQLQRQWFWAIDAVGNLKQSQEPIYHFVLRLHQVQDDWELLSSVPNRLIEVIQSDAQANWKNTVAQIVSTWEVLWFSVSDLHGIDATSNTQIAIQTLLNLMHDLEVNE